MKKSFLVASCIFITLISLLSGCDNSSSEDPCNGTGQLCVENKMDSTVTVNIVEKKQQVTLPKDFMKCFDLEANQPYTISISGSGYTKPDTTLMILPCDNKLFIVTQ